MDIMGFFLLTVVVHTNMHPHEKMGYVELTYIFFQTIASDCKDILQYSILLELI